MKHRIITISREFGSGGRTIGKSVAQRLHIPCYDQELIETIAEKSGFSQDYVRRTGEDTPRGGWFANALVGRSLSGASNQDYLWSIQRRTILELAQQGPCVIVGRCADAILKDQADCLTVFIHAPWRSGPNGSSSDMAKPTPPRKSVCGRRTAVGRPIISSTPTWNGVRPKTSTSAWTAAHWVWTGAWI